MKFEFDFNEEAFRKQQRLAFELKYGKRIRKYKTNLAYIILIFGLCILLIVNRNQWGIFVVAAATFLLINNLYGQFFFTNLRKQLEQLIDHEAQEFLNANQKVSCELSEERFTYSDYKLSMSLIWSKFKTYEVVNDTLLLHPFEKNFFPFIFDKQELGAEQFERMCQFIATKINT